MPDELLSSWLVRLARRSGLKLQTFCRMNFGDRSIWNRDIDKLADESLLKILVVGTGTPPEQVFNTTLAAYRDWLYLQHNPYGNTQWVLPLGVYHRLRRGYDRLNPNTGSFSLGAGSMGEAPLLAVPLWSPMMHLSFATLRTRNSDPTSACHPHLYMLQSTESVLG